MPEHLIFEGTYLRIFEYYVQERKTPILVIKNWDDMELGQIKWYQSWRKFCFYPDDGTIWDNKCLSELLEFINKYNGDWRKNNVKKKNNNA